MKAARAVLVLVVAMLIAAPALAQEAKKERGRRGAAAGGRLGGMMDPARMLEGLDLTADQKAKVAEIQKEFQPKMEAARKKMEGLLTAEQKEARDAAVKKAKEAGKNEREAAQAGREAIKLTDEQRTKLAEVMKEQMGSFREIREKMTEILTAEQKEKLQKRLEAFKTRAPKKDEK